MLAVLGFRFDLGLGGQSLQGDLVQRRFGQLQPRLRRRPRQGVDQGGQGVEVEVGGAPFGGGDGLELMLLHGLDQILVHLLAFPRHPERAVLAIAPGAPSDLRHLGRS